MPETEETVLLGWARDADGGSQRFTGERIYERAGVWCMDRLRRGIPTISTWYCTVRGLYFTSELVAVPMGPLRSGAYGSRMRCRFWSRGSSSWCTRAPRTDSQRGRCSRAEKHHLSAGASCSTAALPGPAANRTT